MADHGQKQYCTQAGCGNLSVVLCFVGKLCCSWTDTTFFAQAGCVLILYSGSSPVVADGGGFFPCLLAAICNFIAITLCLVDVGSLVFDGSCFC